MCAVRGAAGGARAAGDHIFSEFVSQYYVVHVTNTRGMLPLVHGGCGVRGLDTLHYPSWRGSCHMSMWTSLRPHLASGSAGQASHHTLPQKSLAPVTPSCATMPAIAILQQNSAGGAAGVMSVRVCREGWVHARG